MILLLTLGATGCLDELQPSGGWSAPVPADEFMYVGTSDGRLVRVNAETSQVDPAWGFPVGDPIGAMYGSPQIHDGAAYAAGYNRLGQGSQAQVFAIDVATGQPLWRETSFVLATEIVGSVAVDNGTLIFGTSQVERQNAAGGYLYALDTTADAGRPLAEAVPARVKWRFPVEGRIWGSPVIQNGVAYFGSMDGHVYAVDLEDRPEYENDVMAREVWRFKTGGAVVGAPLVEGEQLFIGAFDNTLYALNINARAADASQQTLDPQREWSFEAGGWFWAQPVMEDGVLFAGTLAGGLFALDARNGRELWNSPARIDGQIVAAPALFNMGGVRALAVPSSEEGVTVIHAGNGSEIGAFAARAGVKASPTARDGIVFVHTLEDELIAYSSADLTRRACVNVREPARRC